MFITSDFFKLFNRNRRGDWIWNAHSPNFLMHQIRKVRLFHISSCIDIALSFHCWALEIYGKLSYSSTESVQDIICHKWMHFSWHQWSWFDLHPWKHWPSLCTSVWLESQWLSGNIMLMSEIWKWGKGMCHKQRSGEKSSPAFSSRYLYSFSRQYLFFNSENQMKTTV